MSELFHLSGFGFTYPQQRTPALTDVELTIRSGEFWVLCGPSGCGKSTLLRQLKTVLAPHGVTKGEVYFQGAPLREIPLRQQAADIGFVLQSPEQQVVTDKVWHELAFGLESLGCDTPSIRRRVAEMASFFGIQDWFHKSVEQLSGGQKQLLSLASVMVMQPKVLILDEPTSQLDPIAAADFLQTLGRINRELGTTILLTEHRLEEALPLATHAAVLDGGRLLCTGSPVEVGRALRSRGHEMFLAMPAAMRIWASVASDDPAPVTVREGRDFLHRWRADHPLLPLPPEETHRRGGPVLTAEGICRALLRRCGLCRAGGSGSRCVGWSRRFRRGRAAVGAKTHAVIERRAAFRAGARGGGLRGRSGFGRLGCRRVRRFRGDGLLGQHGAAGAADHGAVRQLRAAFRAEHGKTSFLFRIFSHCNIRLSILQSILCVLYSHYLLF